MSPAARSTASQVGPIGSDSVVDAVGQPRSPRASAMPHVTLKQAMLPGGRHSRTANGPAGSWPSTTIARSATCCAAVGSNVVGDDGDRRSSAMRSRLRSSWVRLSTPSPIAATTQSMTAVVIESSKLEPRHKKSAPAAQRSDGCVGNARNPTTLGHSIHVERIGDDGSFETHRAQVLGPEAADRDRLVVDGICDNMSSED